MKRKRADKRIRAWGIAALLSAVLLAVLSCGLYGCLFAPNAKDARVVEIPDLRGLQEDELPLADWMRVEYEYRYDADTPKGIVMLQTPSGGSRRKLTAKDPVCTLSLVISLGKESLPLPDVRGMDVREAEALLRDKGFVVERVVRDSDRTVGTVLSMQPPPQEGLLVGSRVVLTVSAGEPIDEITVPDLCGLSRAEALLQIWRVGLVAHEVIEIDSALPNDAGRVLRQSHLAGTLVPAKTEITLYVGRAYEE